MLRALARRIGTGVLGVGIALGLVSCGGEPTKKVSLEDRVVKPDCYTVDPYDPIPISEPASGVPDRMSAFLGAWGGGAWEGAVCHDLWVMEVGPDGSALMFDAHGPGFHPDATAFTRKGRITEDGRLRVRKGRAVVEYWLDNGRLYGERRIGQRVQRIILSRKS
ncbi:MAG: hypothetical protein ACQEUZ_04310 [Pseudomonadota bacterium]